MSSKHISRRVEIERHGGSGHFQWRINLSMYEEKWLKYFSTPHAFIELTGNLDVPVNYLFKSLYDASRAKDFFVDHSMEGEYTQEYLGHLLGTDFNLSFWVKSQVWTGLDTLTQAKIKLLFEDVQKFLISQIYKEMPA
jgi:hypothetical protein